MAAQPITISNGNETETGNGNNGQVEVESVKCASCGLTEECTPTYILRVRERYKGKWICGLCAEAVKDEVLRSDRLISIDEALNRHTTFYKKFRSTPKTEHPISVMGRILRRSLDNSASSSTSNSSRGRVPVRSNSSSILPDIKTVQGPSSLLRSESCFSSLSR